MDNNSLFKRSVISLSIAGALAPTSPLIAQEESAPAPVVEEVIVLGVRQSLQQSMDIKRESESVVDAITSTDIGKLPDATLADSLQRITGVQITRSAGEGAGVNIRGNGNVAVTLNGEEMISAGSITTVQPNFADIPSTMVSGMTVVKSPTASTHVGGISGAIDLQTYRPLDLDEGLTLSGKVDVAQGSYLKETDPSVAMFSAYNHDDVVAASLNVSHSKSNLADFVIGSTGQDWGFYATESDTFASGDQGVDANRDDLYSAFDEESGEYVVAGTPSDRYYAFQGHEATNRWVERERTGINGSIQWRINDDFELTTDVFYTDLDEHQYEASFIASQAWQSTTGWFDLLPGGYVEHEANRSMEENYNAIDGANFASVNNAIWQSRRNMSHSEANWTQKEAFNSNIQLDYDNGGPFKASFRYVHGEGKEDSELSVIDTYMNDGTQGGASVKGVGGNALGPVNPWGYAGVPGYAYHLNVDADTGAESWERQNAGFTVIPVGIGYSNNSQHWNLPLFSADAQPLLTADGEQVLQSGAPATVYIDDGAGNLVEYAGNREVLGQNVNRYSLTSANLSGYYRFAEMDAVRFDGSFEFDSGLLTKLKFGVRSSKREVEQDTWIGVGLYSNNYADPFVARWKDPNTGAPLTGESYTPLIAFNDAALNGLVTQVDDLEGVSGISHFWAIDPEAMANPSAFHERIYGAQAKLSDPSLSYNYEEKVNRLYLQGNFEGQIGSANSDFELPFNANIGLRVVRTDMDINQTEIAAADTFSINGRDYLPGPGSPSVAGGQLDTRRSYTDYLPAANVAFDVTDNQIVRLAYSKNMSSHDANALAGGVSVTRILGCNLQTPSGETIFCATSANANGNPNLDPWRSANWEASWEWYFGDVSMINVGYFQYKIESFPVSATWEDPDIADSDGVVRGYDLESGNFKGTVTTNGQVNGDEEGMIEGVEMGYQHELDDLIEGTRFSGLGWQLNYTFSPSKSGQFDYYGKELPMVDNSKHQLNAIAYYENHGWELRLAYNYRSERYISQRNLSPVTLARMAEPTRYLDASVRYTPWDDITFSLQGTNLTEEGVVEYLQWPDLNDKSYFNERRITLGVQAKF